MHWTKTIAGGLIALAILITDHYSWNGHVMPFDRWPALSKTASNRSLWRVRVALIKHKDVIAMVSLLAGFALVAQAVVRTILTWPA